MTVSTPTVVPEIHVSGTAPTAELAAFRPVTTRDFALLRVSQPDYHDWLRHITPASGCTRPIRLGGTLEHVTIQPGGTWSYTTTDTADMPDGVIYKPCGNRRSVVCPSCARLYQRDAYHVVRSGLVGGKGIPETVATHPAVFPTFTAPSFGPVHTRAVTVHTCTQRRHCDCRPRPCHPDRTNPTCPHDQALTCYARHDPTDPRLGQPLCLDCYDHDHQAVWNHSAGELWRRTTLTALRHLRATAKRRGINPATVKLSYGKVAEMQRRGVVHYHAIVRLDAIDPADPGATLPPPAGLGLGDLVDAIEHAARTTAFTTEPHPVNPAGWPIRWGSQFDLRTVNTGTDGAITDGMVAGYLAKYATKSTEAAGHSSGRLTHETIDVYADPDGTHTQRLVEACWLLGQSKPWRRLRRWAHMLGFGGHFLTKSRAYSITFRFLREQRIEWQRAQTNGPDVDDQADSEDITLVVNFLQFVGAGWHNTGDALLANSAADMARRRRETAREELTTTNES